MMIGIKHTQVHDVVTADGTVVDDNVPSPESDSVPLTRGISLDLYGSSEGTTYLLDFETLLSVRSSVGLGGLSLGRSIGHLNVGHVC